MPLQWDIDLTSRLVVAVADGDVTRLEFEVFLDDMALAGAMPFRKLFDGRFGETMMGAADLMAIGARIRSFHTMPVGPLAVLVPEDKFELIARVLGALAAADRPMRLFADLAQARRWIDRFARSSRRLGDAASSTGIRKKAPTG